MNEFDINRLIEILPKLIQENNAIKGAIITALSGVVATHEDIKELIREMDKRFEAMQQQMDNRFDATEKRFEAMDKRFDAMQQQMDKRFDAMQQQMDKKFGSMDKRLDQIAIGADVSFELFCKSMIKSFLETEEKKIPYIETGRHFKDSDYEVFTNTTDIEIDLFCPDPPIIGEVTYNMKDLKKIRKFLRKIQFMEKHIFKQKAQKYFCALEIDPKIYKELESIAEKNQICIISKERKE